MRPPAAPIIFLVSMIYSSVIALGSFLVYFLTTELHKLSQHKGIGAFRNAFLFLGISVLLRMIVRSPALHYIGFFGKEVAFLLLTYTSFVTVLYLLYSVVWKTLPKRFQNHLWVHGAAVLTALLFLATHEPKTKPVAFLLLQMLIVLTAAIAGYQQYKKQKTAVSKTYVSYVLLFLFWALDTARVFFARPFHMHESLILYGISIILFIIIIARILVRIQNHGKKKRTT